MEYMIPENFNREYISRKRAEYQEIFYDSKIIGVKRKANVLLPLDYSTSKKYPVLYLIHGIGGDENEWKNAGIEYILSNLLNNGAAKEMIVVLVNARVRVNDEGNPKDIFTKAHFESFDRIREDLIESIMPYMKENYSILEGREHTAVAGLSMGGRESLYIGLSRTELFGYIGAFSPAFGLLPYTNNGVTEQGLFEGRELRVPKEYEKSTFLMIMHGNEDGVVRDEPVRYHTVLELNRTPHLFSMVQGGHDFNVWSNGLYQFMQRIF